MQEATRTHDISPTDARIALLESEVTSLRAQLTVATSALASLRERYHRLLEELQLLKRRLAIAKAERLDVSAAQLAFDTLLAEAKTVEKAIEAIEMVEAAAAATEPAGAPPAATPERTKTKPKGRRDLSKCALPSVRVEVSDPELEGKAECIGFEETSRLGYERGGHREVIVARKVYKVYEGAASSCDDSLADGCGDACATASTNGVDHGVADLIATDVVAIAHDVTVSDVVAAPDVTATRTNADSVASSTVAGNSSGEAVLTTNATTERGDTPRDAVAENAAAARRARLPFHIVTAPMPKEITRRGMLAPSMIAHLLAMKYVLGVPFNRYEQQCTHDGVALDRSTMCRYAEHVGATLGCIVEAARKEALATAFCLSTDATGVAIQPTRLEAGKSQPCRKGHFFVTLADRDHVFFDFQPKHTSLTVWDMFKGFTGYVQADAHAIYNALFKGVPPEGAAEEPHECGPPPIEVGCWCHARRKFWEAAICKHLLGVEGVRRINAFFDIDRPLVKLPPAARKLQRDRLLRPLVDDFFVWAKAEYAKLTARGLVATALGYAIRQERPLRQFLEDGRLRMENNAAERALRTVAVGRKAWLFYGSDDHATAAGNVLSLVASCKLFDLDPEAYLTDIIRVLPYWPRDRHLELAPKHWRATRARLDPEEMKRPLGHVSVPPPLRPPEQQPSPN